MDPAYWTAIASIESSLKPGSNYGNPGTQYKGLYQIGTRGSGSEWATHGSGNVYNPMDNANAAASLAAENNAAFQNHFGRAPTPIETYMMHQQGLGFYTHGTMTNVSGNAYPGMSGPQTPASFEAGWGRELERRAKAQGGDDMPTADSVASSSGTSGIPRSVTASAGGASAGGGQPSADTSQPDNFDVGAELANVRNQIAQQEQANAPPPLAPMQLQAPTPPSMQQLQRAKFLAQIMALRDQQSGGTTGSPPL